VAAKNETYKQEIKVVFSVLPSAKLGSPWIYIEHRTLNFGGDP
jgi:hypothetical protein